MWFSSGKKKCLFFKTEKLRDAKFADLEKAARRGTLDLVPTSEEIRNWRAFVTATEGTDWQTVVSIWKRHSQDTGTLQLTVDKAVEAYLADAKKRVLLGRYSQASYDHKDTMMTRFRDAFSEQQFAAITPAAMEKWIVEGLGFKNPATFNSYRKALIAIYNFYKDDIPKNPAKKMHSRGRGIETVGILTVAQTAQLFAYAKEHYPKALARLALEAFAGLRFSSSSRVEKSEINFKDRGVLLPKHKIKTGRKYYVDGYPENLWAWLELANEDGWAMENAAWMHLKSKLFLAARVTHPHNCLRHSFCTHHIASFKNPGLTATLLCHHSQEQLWAHYNGLATQEAGKAYWTITPASAATMAKDEGLANLHYPTLTGKAKPPAEG